VCSAFASSILCPRFSIPFLPLEPISFTENHSEFSLFSLSPRVPNFFGSYSQLIPLTRRTLPSFPFCPPLIFSRPVWRSFKPFFLVNMFRLAFGCGDFSSRFPFSSWPSPLKTWVRVLAKLFPLWRIFCYRPVFELPFRFRRDTSQIYSGPPSFE